MHSHCLPSGAGRIPLDAALPLIRPGVGRRSRVRRAAAQAKECRKEGGGGSGHGSAAAAQVKSRSSFGRPYTPGYPISGVASMEYARAAMLQCCCNHQALATCQHSGLRLRPAIRKRGISPPLASQVLRPPAADQLLAADGAGDAAGGRRPRWRAHHQGSQRAPGRHRAEQAAGPPVPRTPATRNSLLSWQSTSLQG